MMGSGRTESLLQKNNAKKFIKEKVLESDLREKAELQGFKMLEFVKTIVDSQEWTLEMMEDSAPPQLAN